MSDESTTYTGPTEEILSADPRWSIWQTGGGCTALCRHVVVERGDGSPFWMITVVDDPSAPATMDEPVTLGLYDANGDEVGGWLTLPSVWVALALANTFTVGEGL